MPHVATKHSELAHVPQDFPDNYDNWWDNINLHGFNIPDYHYDGSDSQLRVITVHVCQCLWCVY